MIGGIIVVLIIVAIFVTPVVGMYLGNIKFKGALDAQYPAQADGDIYVGFRRAVYLRGYHAALRKKKTDKAKKAMTQERMKARGL